MRRPISWLVGFALICTLLPIPVYAAAACWTDGVSSDNNAVYSGGTGTEADPYLISTAADLAQLSVNVAANITYSDKYFYMTQDIDLSGKYWAPIGNKGGSFGEQVFCGTFNGGGYVVQNVLIDQDEVTATDGAAFGFFGRLYGAVLRNFGIQNGTVLHATKDHNGLLAGYLSDSTVENCYATGSVSADGGDNVGGLIGQCRYSTSQVNNCFFIGTVSAAASVSYAAGLVASLKNSSHAPLNCYAAASVDATGATVYPLAPDATNGCYDSTIGPGAAGGGTGRTTGEMKTADTAALLNDGGTAWLYDVNKNAGYPYLTVMTDLNIFYLPSAQTQNGITAAVSFRPAAAAEGVSVTAVVTLTGTATAAGTHTIDLTSTKVGLTSDPQTVTVTAGQDLTAAPGTKSFTFTMPAENVDDFILTHTFEAADATAPVLTSSSVWRSACDTATVRFMSDESGTCYYQITDSATPPADVVADGTNGGAVTADTAKMLPLAGLTAGAKYVHIVVEDAGNNVGDPMTVAMPYDYYYHEGFESYPLDTYISSNDMSPLHQVHNGTGNANQKVAANVTNSSEKMLSLSSASSWASDQVVALNRSTLAAGSSYVFEGDVYALGTSGWQLRFSFTTGTYSASTEAGIYFKNGNIVSISNSERVLLSGYTANQWYHVKIEVSPSVGTYAVYVNGALLDNTLTLPTGIDRLAITSGHGYTAYYDNLEFYLVAIAPRYAVEFNENNNAAPSERAFYIAAGSADFYTTSSGGSLQTLAAPTRSGYVFGGWYKEAACTNQILSAALALNANTDYTDSSALWTKAEAVTLYAKWLEKTPAGIDFDYENEMITGLTVSAEYAIGGTAVTADADGKTAIQSGWFDTALSVVKKGISSDYSFDSQAATLNVPARAAAPTTPAGIDEAYPGAGDGQITGVSDTMEYKLSSSSGWTSVGSGVKTITGMDDGIYYVRYRAVTSGSPSFASAYVSVTVGTTGTTPETKPAAAPNYTEEKLTGLTAGSEYDVGGTPYTADGSGEIVILNDWFSTTISVVKKGNGTTTTNSTAQILHLAARPATPTDGAFTLTQPTASVSTGTIVGITAAMEYSTDGGTNWTAGNGSAVSGLVPGNVLIRVTSTASAPKSGNLTITITAYKTPTGGGTTGGGETGNIEIISSDGDTMATGTITNVENGVNIAIPAEQVDLLAGSGQSVILDTGTVTVSFDAAAIDHIDSTAGSNDMILEITRVDSADLPEKSRPLIGDRPVYEFSLTAGENSISSFGGGTAIVSIPYTLGSDEDPNAVVVYYIDGSGNLIPVTGQYDADTGTVTFTAEHFSVYAVGYNYMSFNDVAYTDWYYDAVTFSAARGITDGTGDGNYSPDTALTRGQFLVMLMRAYGIEADEERPDNFDDAGDTYYTGYLSAAKRLSISNGVGNNLYAPKNAITRQEMFTLLYRALTVIGQLPERTSGKTLSDFSDAGNIDSWAKDAIKFLVETGTISGNGGKLRPTDTTTRAEMAQLLYNLFLV